VAEDLARKEYTRLKALMGRQEAGLPAPLKMSATLDEFEGLDMPQAPNARRAYRDSLKPIRSYFVGFLGDPRVDQVRGPDVVRFLDWRSTHRIGSSCKPVSARTVQKDRAVLHRVFARAERRGYRDGNPVKLAEAPKSDGRQPVILTEGQFESLLGQCKHYPMLNLYVLALNETGARCESEMLWLRWEDIDLEEGFVQIVSGRDGHRTKGGRSRWTPMTTRLRQAMRQHFAAYRFAVYGAQPTPWLFHHLVSQRKHKAGERVKSFYDAFKGAAKRASLPPTFVQHDLRHRRVTTWLAEEKNPVHVRDAVGHADLRTTMGYTHLVKENLRALVEEPRKATKAG